MSDDTRRRLVDRLIAMQQASGLSHREFAKTIGVSESNWWHIRDRGQVSLDVLREAARRYPGFAIELLNEMVA